MVGGRGWTEEERLMLVTWVEAKAYTVVRGKRVEGMYWGEEGRGERERGRACEKVKGGRVRAGGC